VIKANGKKFKYLYVLIRDRSCFLVAGLIGDVPVILAKPQTFMNSSGESVCVLSGYNVQMF